MKPSNHTLQKAAVEISPLLEAGVVLLEVLVGIPIEVEVQAQVGSVVEMSERDDALFNIMNQQIEDAKTTLQPSHIMRNAKLRLIFLRSIGDH